MPLVTLTTCPKWAQEHATERLYILWTFIGMCHWHNRQFHHTGFCRRLYYFLWFAQFFCGHFWTQGIPKHRFQRRKYHFFQSYFLTLPFQKAVSSWWRVRHINRAQEFKELPIRFHLNIPVAGSVLCVGELGPVGRDLSLFKMYSR